MLVISSNISIRHIQTEPVLVRLEKTLAQLREEERVHENVMNSYMHSGATFWRAKTDCGWAGSWSQRGVYSTGISTLREMAATYEKVREAAGEKATLGSGWWAPSLPRLFGLGAGQDQVIGSPRGIDKGAAGGVGRPPHPAARLRGGQALCLVP